MEQSNPPTAVGSNGSNGSNAGLGAASEARCMCKDRALSACPGEWEPGCDLGNNPEYCIPAPLVFAHYSELQAGWVVYRQATPGCMDCKKVAGPFETREEAEALLGPLLRQLKAPNVEFSGVPAGHSSNHPAGGASAGTQG